MKPELPLYQYLYLDGPRNPPVLTSEEVLRGYGSIAAQDYFANTRICSRHLEKHWHLYKYRSVDVESDKSVEMARSFLVMEEIWFSSASLFNDAFEMDFQISLPDARTFSAGLRRNQELFKQMKLAPAKRLLHKEKTLRLPPVLTDEMEMGFRKSLDEALGIYCVSEDPRSELMWAHYADSNRGFCVQLGVYNDPIFFHAQKVNYTDERISVPLFTESRPQGHLYKKLSWAYEKEWRLSFLDVKGKLRLRNNSVVGVIFGTRASKSTIDVIRGLNNERVKIGKTPLILYQSYIDRENRRYKIRRM